MSIRLLLLMVLLSVSSGTVIGGASNTDQPLRASGAGYGGTRPYGFKDSAGNWAITPQFDYAHDFSDGLALVGLYNGSPIMIAKANPWFSTKYGFVDSTGKFIIPPRFTAADSFSEGLAPAMVGDMETGHYGYIDKTGKWAIPARFDQAQPFSEGLAAVAFYFAEPQPRGGDYHVLKVEGFKSFNYRRYGYIDRAGRMVIKPRFDDAQGFSEGLAAVRFGGRKEGKWGYVDKTGVYVIHPRFSRANPFSGDAASVEIDYPESVESLIIDKTGQTKIRFPLRPRTIR